MEGAGVTETKPHTASESYEQGIKKFLKKETAHMKHVYILVFSLMMNPSLALLLADSVPVQPNADEHFQHGRNEEKTVSTPTRYRMILCPH